ncbi:ABC transporter permease [Hoeflea sp. BAL378]|uniref:ABC transporter substrate-binding protein n=1 Tax=Hoeflea sp. BAL378 TaxID=1547437 RepID=UPI0005139423|nr:ABC transporter substrate-binding protein [Hoeflea sp. BAL378]KGF70462.1 ABC transporter permease [Hoeflea sp. BAL378]
MNVKMLATLAASALFASTLSVLAQDKVSVKLSYIVDHPAIDAARDGVIDTLKAAGFVEGENLDLEVQSAQGNMTTQAQINQKFVGDSPDLIVAISTPSAQTAMSATSDIPIVFAAITDPLAAGLVDSNEKPGRNLTGSSDKTPVDRHLQLVKRIVPEAKTIGIVYNGGEANSVALVEELRAEATKLGLEVVEATAIQSSAVLDAARSLVGKVDAIYVPTDSTVVSAFESVARIGGEADIPVIAADTTVVERGAIAALGFSYYDIGVAAGESAVRILNGENPADIPVRFIDKLELYVNPGAAEEMGISLPDDLLAEATRVIE